MTDYEREVFLKDWQPAQQIALPVRITEQYYLLSVLKETAQDQTCLLSEKVNGNLYILKSCLLCPQNTAGQEYHMLLFLRQKQAPKSIFVPETMEYFEENGRAYLLRNYIYGFAFHEYAAKSPSDSLSERELLRCGIQLCEALEFLHGQNPAVIHRDIKPGNVILDPYGCCHLIDFGIARHYKAGRNSDTFNMGSENSAAPEQFGYAQTDARTDIYSLGTLLLYGATCEYDIKKLEYADISDRLKAIIRKCMQFAPQDRYQSAAGLHRDLLKCQNQGIHRQKFCCFFCGIFIGALVMFLGLCLWLLFIAI